MSKCLAYIERFANGLGALALMIGTDGKEKNAEEAKQQQDIILKNCGVPALRHVEALTGLLSSDATIFPSAIGMGATWNPELVHTMADIARKQMLAIGIISARILRNVNREFLKFPNFSIQLKLTALSRI